MNKLLDYTQLKNNDTPYNEIIQIFEQYLNTTSFESIKEQVNTNTEEFSILNNLIASNDLVLLKIMMDYDIQHHFFIDWNLKNKEDRGHNPLLKAIYYDNEKALDLILSHAENGASIDFTIKHDHYDDNIIMLCLRNVDNIDTAHLSILKTLLNYKDKHNINLNLYEEDELKYGVMAIALRARGDINQKIEMLHLLFDYGYDINHQDSRGNSFLSGLIKLADEIESINLFQQQYELFKDILDFEHKNLKKIFEISAYSYNSKLLNHLYSLEEFEKLEHVEYIQNHYFTKKTAFNFSPKTIEFFNQKNIALIEKEKKQIEEQLNHNAPHMISNKKVKI